jgi:hypothetical protein
MTRMTPANRDSHGDFILYHFTSKTALPSILKHGIARGDGFWKFPNGQYTLTFSAHPDAEYVAVPWLTTNSEPTLYEALSTGEGANIKGSGRYQHNKTKLRLSVRIDKHDLALHYWPTFARKHSLDSEDVEHLSNIGNGEGANWYIYHPGVIAPSAIVKVKEMAGPDDFWKCPKCEMTTVLEPVFSDTYPYKEVGDHCAACGHWFPIIHPRADTPYLSYLKTA